MYYLYVRVSATFVMYSLTLQSGFGLILGVAAAVHDYE